MLKRIKRVTTKTKRVKKRSDPIVTALTRYGEVVTRLHSLAKTKAAKQKAREAAAQYHTAFHDHLFFRIRQVVAHAEKVGTWDFMDGCFSQAVEVYAVAALAYENFDDPIMPDGRFDDLAKFLYKNYARITDYCKETWKLNKGIFRAGTGSHFASPKQLPGLMPYYNRLQAHYEAEAKERERIRTKNKPRLLRKAPNGGQPPRKKILRRLPKRS